MHTKTRGKKLLTPGRIHGKKRSKEFLEKSGLVTHDNGIFPRNLPAYEAINAAFPDFDYHFETITVKRKHKGNVVGTREVQRVVFKNYPMMGGDAPSLADLVRESMREHGESAVIVPDKLPSDVQKKVNMISGIKNATEFIGLLLDLPAVVPPLEVLDKIGKWLEVGAEKGEVVIFCPVCPDYATMETGDPQRPIVYTFDGLGTGVGIVAKRAQTVIPHINTFFKERGIKVRFVVAMGDFEADSQETLHRVGLTRQEYLERVRLSQHAFAHGLSHLEDVHLETPLMTELFSSVWYQTLERAKQAVSQRDFGAITIDEKTLSAISAARESLYKRWYGCDVDALSILLAQAPEYMTVGNLVENHFDNAMILGADAVAMASFMHGLGDECRPVVYLRSKPY